MRKLIVLCSLLVAMQANAQIKIGGQSFDLSQLLSGKVLNVSKGFKPKFSIGNLNIGKLQTVAQLLAGKNNLQIDKYFRIFRTGKTVWHAGEIITTLASVYGVVRGLKANDIDATTQQLRNEKDKILGNMRTGVYTALGSALSGLVVKLLTKKASYKAVDMFNGVVKKKLSDILSVQPYQPNIPNYSGVGIAISLK
jgi:hypothetical protein